MDSIVCLVSPHGKALNRGRGRFSLRVNHCVTIVCEGSGQGMLHGAPNCLQGVKEVEATIAARCVTVRAKSEMALRCDACQTCAKASHDKARSHNLLLVRHGSNGYVSAHCDSWDGATLDEESHSTRPRAHLTLTHAKRRGRRPTIAVSRSRIETCCKQRSLP